MTLADRNQVMLRKLLVITLIMTGFCFAMVPFYRKICEVTGVAQTRETPVDEAQAAPGDVVAGREVTVEFFAGNNGDLKWQFEPLQHSLKVHPGQVAQITYRVVNNTGHAVVAQAVPSFGPTVAGQYFRKLQCFCFERQTFRAGETRELPVVFVVEKGLPTDVGTVTLSYTFFDITAETGAKG